MKRVSAFIYAIVLVFTTCFATLGFHTSTAYAASTPTVIIYQTMRDLLIDGYNMYKLDSNGNIVTGRYLDIDGKWYQLDQTTGAMLYGWYKEVLDVKWYFLSPYDGHMLTGWQYIDSKYYFFTEINEGQTYFGNNFSGWTFDAQTTIRPYGSMFANEVTPDGYVVNADGVWVK